MTQIDPNTSRLGQPFSLLKVGDFETSYFDPSVGDFDRPLTLTIRKLKEVTLEERIVSGLENQKQTVWDFGIFLTQEDATRLKSLTAANISKKLLVIIGDETVSAPTILGPLETGSFAIECTERPLMEIVKKQLAIMERQSQ